MRSLFHSEFFRRFAGGFVLGAIGLMMFQPAQASGTLLSKLIG